MITYLEGSIKDIDGRCITLLAGQVGYGILVVDPISLSIGQNISFFIRLVWHQEEGPQLYGFLDKQERVVFDLVTSCSGCGPKIALATLETMKPGIFIRAVEEHDTALLSSISGVGKKKAESMVLYLKDKVAKLISKGFIVDNQSSLSVLKDVSGVLASLGYSQKEITAATAWAREELSLHASFDEYLKKALAYLSKQL